MPSSEFIVETQNGTIQLSLTKGDSPVGLLVERGGFSCGTLLSSTQAEHLARLLLNGVRSSEIDDT